MYLVEHDLLQEVQPDIVGRRAFAEPGIVALAAKEFNIVVALVKMEIQIAAALRAFQIAGKTLGSWVTVGACAVSRLLTPVPFPKLVGQ